MSTEIVIRADASNTIGAGHVMRCLSLAGELRSQGSVITFVCQESAGDCCDLIEEKGFRVFRLSGCADWQDDSRQTLEALQTHAVRPDCLVVDHYGLESRWERNLRGAVRSVAVIDDLADRPHECELLLDQNYYDDLDRRYDGLVPRGARRLLGPHFALLRPEFVRAPSDTGPPAVDRLFVSVGAHDPFGLCEKAVAAVRLVGHDSLGAEIVAGADAQLRERLRDAVSDLSGVRVHGFVHEMSSLMARCSMAFGAGGSSTWERCALGIPALVTVVADNQRRMSQDLARAGIIVLLGEARELTVTELAAAIARCLSDRSLLESLRLKSRALVDGGGSRRVAEEVLGIAHA